MCCSCLLYVAEATMSKEPTEYCALLNQVSYYIYYRIMLISFVDIVRGKDDPVSLQSLKIDVVDITSGICLAGLVFAIFGKYLWYDTTSK